MTLRQVIQKIFFKWFNKELFKNSTFYRLPIIIKFCIISENVCDVADWGYDLPSDFNKSTDEFFLHLFVRPPIILNNTIIVKIEFRSKDRYRLGFYYRWCSEVDSKTEVDVLGRCNSTTPLLLKEFKLNIVHVTVKRTASAKKLGVIESNKHCVDYDENIKCINLGIPESNIFSNLSSMAVYGSVDCISGKI